MDPSGVVQFLAQRRKPFALRGCVRKYFFGRNGCDRGPPLRCLWGVTVLKGSCQTVRWAQGEGLMWIKRPRGTARYLFIKQIVVVPAEFQELGIAQWLKQANPCLLEACTWRKRQTVRKQTLTNIISGTDEEQHLSPGGGDCWLGRAGCGTWDVQGRPLQGADSPTNKYPVDENEWAMWDSDQGLGEYVGQKNCFRMCTPWK